MRKESLPESAVNPIPYFWRGVGILYRSQPFIYLLLFLFLMQDSLIKQDIHPHFLFWLIASVVIVLCLLWVHHLNTRYLSTAAEIFGLKATATILKVQRLYETREKQGIEHYIVDYELEVRPKQLAPYKATGSKKMPFHAVNHLRPGMEVSVRYLPNKKEIVVITENMSNETLLNQR